MVEPKLEPEFGFRFHSPSSGASILTYWMTSVGCRMCK